MAICVLTFAIEKSEDKEIKSVLEFALELSKSQSEQVKKFLSEENYPIPVGFTEQDVNLKAPPLFSDIFMIIYMYVMTLHGLTGYAGAIGNAVRRDQRDYFIQCNQGAMELYNKIIDVMLQKGILSRPPNINPPKEVHFVTNQSYLSGWFEKKRPLNAIEVSGIFYNMQKNLVKIGLEIAFSQVVTSKELYKYIKRGEKLCKKHHEVFSSFLAKDNLSPPKRWENEVTSSTVAPFSEKLMLFHIVTLISAAMGFYGAGLSVSQRRDLSLQYAALITEIGIYAEDGVNLLIENGWLEQPPMVEDREKLAMEKGLT